MCVMSICLIDLDLIDTPVLTPVQQSRNALHRQGY